MSISRTFCEKHGLDIMDYKFVTPHFVEWLMGFKEGSTSLEPMPAANFEPYIEDLTANSNYANEIPVPKPHISTRGSWAFPWG